MIRHTGEDFIDVECVAVTLVLPLQAPSVYSSEFDTPKADSFATNCDASFSEKVFNIPMTQIEAIIEPGGIQNDIGQESVALVSIHPPILASSGS